MAADTAISALDVLSRCGRYAGWLYDLAAPHLGKRVVEVGAGLGTQSQVMLNSPGSELKEFLLTDSDPARVKTLSQRFGPRSDVRAATWELPEPFPSARAQGGEFRVNTTTTDDQKRPAVAMVAAWGTLSCAVSRVTDE